LFQQHNSRALLSKLREINITLTYKIARIVNNSTRQDVLINVTNKTQIERKILNFFQRIRLANKLKEDKPLSQLKIRKGFRMLLINTCSCMEIHEKEKIRNAQTCH
jgi:hypothetical protein